MMKCGLTSPVSSGLGGCSILILLVAGVLAGIPQTSLAQGEIIGWGLGVVVGQEALSGLMEVTAGTIHGLGLKADGSVVAWGDNEGGQCNLPVPNTDFTAVAAGRSHSLGLKADGSIVAWGSNFYGQCGVPSPNTDFTAVAAGLQYSLGLTRIIHEWPSRG